MKNRLNKLTHPCGKCPYKLGLVKMLVNPCPQCKQNGCSFYKHLPLKEIIINFKKNRTGVDTMAKSHKKDIPILPIYYNPKQRRDSSLEMLYEHFGKKICISLASVSDEDVYTLDGCELEEGMLSAVTYSVGYFEIMYAEILYKDTMNCLYTNRVPADKEEIAEYKRFVEKSSLLIWDGKSRKVNEIRARYKPDPDSDWQYVCLATEAKSLAWSEQISFICTAKKHKLKKDKNCSLLVNVNFTGDSRSFSHWYKLSHKGKLKEYVTEGASKEKWTW